MKMSAKKLLAAILAGLVLCAVLASCGEDLDAKKQEIQKKYDELVALCNDLTEALNVLQDAGIELNESAVSTYSEAMEFIDSFGEIDMAGMDAKELKELSDSEDVLIKNVNEARAALSAEMDALG